MHPLERADRPESAPIWRRNLRRRRARSLLRRGGGSGRCDHRAGRGARHGGDGACASRAPRRRRDAAAQSSERPPRSLGRRSQRGRPTCTMPGSASASSTTRLPSSTWWSRCRASGRWFGSTPIDVVATLSENGPVAAQLTPLRRPSQPAGHGRLHRRLLQRRRRPAARSGHRRRGSRSPIWCRRSPGPGPTASAPW